MLVLAHRGYHARAPENTLAAFAAAVELGVDGIETDVRLSRDGLPVIIHDRVTPRNRAIADLTHREIEADVGHPVPVLAEILDAFPDVLWNIEIKSPQAWPVAAPILACYQSKRRLFVTSFWHHVVKRCAEALAIDCGLLMAHRPLDVGAVMATCAEQPRIRSIVGTTTSSTRASSKRWSQADGATLFMVPLHRRSTGSVPDSAWWH